MFHYSQAVMLTSFMVEALRADRKNAREGDYNLGTSSAPHCATPAAGADLPSVLKNEWIDALKNGLGNQSTTCGFVGCSASTSSCTVQVIWDNERGGGNNPEIVEFIVRLLEV